MSSSNRLPAILLTIGILVLLWSGVYPRDRFTWYLEIASVVVGGLILVTTYHRFRFTPLVYTLIFVHAVILLVGAHYTYEQVPLFDHLSDLLDLDRNHYDRLGHFAQGFIPAMIAREVLLRTSPLRRGGWLFTIVTSICLAFSAFWELLEWWVAMAVGGAADAFLGSQGDPWDAQWDMNLALIGAIAAQLLLRRFHDRHLEGVN